MHPQKHFDVYACTFPPSVAVVGFNYVLHQACIKGRNLHEPLPHLQCLCLFGNLVCIAVGLTHLETSMLAKAKVTQEASRWFVFRAVRYKRLI